MGSKAERDEELPRLRQLVDIWRAQGLDHAKVCGRLWLMFLGAEKQRRDETAALRAQVRRLQRVVDAVRLDHEMSIGPEEIAANEKAWWRMPATRAALDALEPSDG